MKYKDSRHVERVWKFALASYTYYGLLFLSYGLISSLFLSVRYFKKGFSNLIGIIIEVGFSIMLVVWVIAAWHYPTWFGSFKKKFFKFQIS